MTTIIFLAGVTHQPLPRHPAVVQRRFAPRGPLKATVTTQHPQAGWLYRGTVTRMLSQPEDGALGRWLLVDHDWTPIGEIVGDYLDAESTLLARTAGLDAPVPPNELEADQ